MSLILKLDQHTANLIAAGEVIERAASVVKELVENSIDAKANSIIISLVDSGVKEITVSDNGVGMDAIDAKLCVEPHATSKIKNEHDLFQIKTLGFRGEALPSIVSVSNFKLKTSQDGIRGIMYSLRAGEIISEALIAHPKGTEISVKNLFFNTPARLQNLQSQNVELSYIVDYVNKMALAMPNIAFKLLNNDRVILQTFGNNNLLEVISNTYGIEIAKSMIDVFNDNGYFKISGFISKINASRSNKNHINIIVNGRVIKSQNLVNAVNEAYKDFMMIGRYPIVVLNIMVDPGLVDVNVHPAKLEVRFSNEGELVRLIKETIIAKLETTNMIIDMDQHSTLEEPNFEHIEEDEENIEEFELDYDLDEDDEDDDDDDEEDNTLEKINKVIKNIDEFNLDKFDSKELEPIDLDDFIISKPKTIDKTYNLENNNEEVKVLKESFTQQKYTLQEEEAIIDENKETKLPKIFFIGQLHGTYVLGQNEENFFIIDQHAAAERINYEKFSKELLNDKIISYELLVPIKLDYPVNEAIIINDNLSEISKLGIKIEEFGGGTFMVREVPIWLFRGKEKEFIEEIINQIINGKKKEKYEFLDNVAKSLACKKSIKGNEYINKLQIEYMLEDLEKCKHPYTCPHGRPVIIKFSKSEIEKWFKRIV